MHSLPWCYRDDDDINDVATMGGVNLTEESRNILASNADFLSGQMRSCKDESFLASQPLVKKINRIGIGNRPRQCFSAAH